jgi:hypothetical protein
MERTRSESFGETDPVHELKSLEVYLFTFVRIRQAMQPNAGVTASVLVEHAL